ncbi:MAG: tRNA (N6-isopentenyl adenosine(37)-C2)-methylthiotransferase MiaB [Candidatus Magasanikbacteria bacterium]
MNSKIQTSNYKYHIITFGCQMNKNDSERIESIFESMDMTATDKPEDADVILMNSCSIRESAEDRIYSFSHEFAKLKEKKPNLIVAVTGCMPGRDTDGKLKKRLKAVDLFFPTKDVIMLPKWLSELNPNFRSIDLEKDYLSVKPHNKSNFQAFVTIQTGCNQFCTYCVVPYARGMEINRPLQDILEEVNTLVNNGCLEITLLGQIVNHWIAKKDDKFSKENPYKQNDFAKLLWELNQIKGLERIHWTAPHPIHMDDEVIDALTLPKQLNFIHLPVQSGSSKILKKMNRKHTRELYLEKIKKIRAKKPDIAIGTDIIIGFCDETDEDFAETMSLYKECDFDIAYTAKYSNRSGTLADKIFPDNITQDEKKRRWFELQQLMENTVLDKNKTYLNKTVSVLVDTFKNGMCGGNSREMKRVNFPGSQELVGKIVNIAIIEAGHWILCGKMLY